MPNPELQTRSRKKGSVGWGIFFQHHQNPENQDPKLLHGPVRMWALGLTLRCLWLPLLLSGTSKGLAETANGVQTWTYIIGRRGNGEVLSSCRQDHRMQLRQVGEGEGRGITVMRECGPGALTLWVLLVSLGSSPTSLDLMWSL